MISLQKYNTDKAPINLPCAINRRFTFIFFFVIGVLKIYRVSQACRVTYLAAGRSVLIITKIASRRCVMGNGCKKRTFIRENESGVTSQGLQG